MKRIVRFVASKKRELVRAVIAGEVRAADAKAEYSISDEEWDSWVRAYSAGAKMTMTGMISSRSMATAYEKG